MLWREILIVGLEMNVHQEEENQLKHKMIQ